MCGIAGWLRRDGNAEAAAVEHMLARLGHRGPDDRGLWAQGAVALGHVRLRILDPSPLGHQPMSTPDGLGLLSYNGEAYNFHELRAELEASGIRFRSRSDTEVVLHALHHWGPERAVPRLNGMFGLAYHDRRDGSLWLARDRLGIKPLHFARTPTGVVFASEIKALLAHPELRCRPDLQVVVSQIIDERIAGESTPFEGIETLLPGTLLEVTRGERAVAYFDVLRDVDPERIVAAGSVDCSEHARRFEELFAASVERHLVSDAPLAVQCSGGIDSGLVTAFAAQRKPDLIAYVADVSNMQGRETGRAQRVCDHLGLELRSVPVDRESYFRLWPQAIFANDQPLYFAQEIAELAVAERMRSDGFAAVLTGDGADELFGGYGWYAASYRRWRRRRRRAAWQERLRSLGPLSQWLRRADAIDLDALAHRPFARNEKPRDAALAARQTAALSTRSVLHEAALFRRLSALPLLEERAYLAHSLADLRRHLGERLRSLDRMAMARSIEARVPFLDNDLIDFALHLPLGAKYRAGQPKWIVRDLALRRLPPGVVRLPKIGFGVEDSMWDGVDGVLKGGALADMLRWRRSEESSLLELVGRHRRFLFRLVGFELWARLFFRGETPDQLSETLLRQHGASAGLR